ncbi:hypothetical protein AVEN_146196-1 [Araneus ventricosus]|uniref:Uncharacterized protein n=1 Tax=Araneus ventricosus TaxID=182803 RepID=A0A4Y2CIQ0_ARAVE|nr:hypothetical protein AVEN_146196-1 [Araneus ventricosus]
MDGRYTHFCPNLSRFPLLELDCFPHQSQNLFHGPSNQSLLRRDLIHHYSSSTGLSLLISSKNSRILLSRDCCFMVIKLAYGERFTHLHDRSDGTE